MVGVFWWKCCRQTFFGSVFLSENERNMKPGSNEKKLGLSIKIRSFSKILELCFQNLPFHVAVRQLSLVRWSPERNCPNRFGQNLNETPGLLKNPFSTLVHGTVDSQRLVKKIHLQTIDFGCHGCQVSHSQTPSQAPWCLTKYFQSLENVLWTMASMACWNWDV